MDVLSDVLRVAQRAETRSAFVTARAPWGVAFDGSLAMSFLVVTEGTAVLHVDGDATEEVRLMPGDAVLLPDDPPHSLADEPGRPTVDITTVGDTEIGGDGARSVLLAGAYVLDLPSLHPLLRGLPEVVHLPAVRGAAPELHGVIDLLAGEISGGHPGTDAAIPRLVDLMLLWILRTWFEQSARNQSWFGALLDPSLGKAIALMHEAPERPWTVEGLAGEAGLSRSAFAQRFVATVGEPPLSYLTAWRMALAADLLRTTDLRLAAIAQRVGYDSEFAFAAAFKRVRGQAPGRYRAAQQRETPG